MKIKLPTLAEIQKKVDKFQFDMAGPPTVGWGGDKFDDNMIPLNLLGKTVEIEEEDSEHIFIPGGWGILRTEWFCPEEPQVEIGRDTLRKTGDKFGFRAGCGQSRTFTKSEATTILNLLARELGYKVTK